MDAFFFKWVSLPTVLGFYPQANLLIIFFIDDNQTTVATVAFLLLYFSRQQIDILFFLNREASELSTLT